MKIDTHTHLLLKKNSPPDWKLINFHFDVAKAHGLDVVCITEHIDAIYFAELYTEIFINNKLGGTILEDGIIQLSNSLIIVSGAEVPLVEGGEVGIHSNLSTILELNKVIKFDNLEKVIQFVLNLTDEYVVIGNHLYFPGKWIEQIEEKLALLDAIEILAKENHKRDKYETLALKLNKPLISGSDSHVWTQLGLGYTDIDSSIYSIKIFKEAIKNNKFTIELSKEAEVFTVISKLYRDYLTSSLV